MQNPFLNRKNIEIHGKYKKIQKNLENLENPEISRKPDRGTGSFIPFGTVPGNLSAARLGMLP